MKYKLIEPSAQPQKYRPISPSEQFNDLPWYAKAGQAADDVVRGLANGVTLGYADQFAGYMNGSGADAERAKTDAAKQRGGSAITAAEILGSMLPASRLSQAASAAGLGGASFGTRTLSMAGQAGLLGTAQRMGNGQEVTPTGVATDMALGAGGNVLGEGLSAGASKVAGLFNHKPAVPSLDELVAQKNAAYGAVDQSGSQYAPEQLRNLRQGLSDDLVAGQATPGLNDKVLTVNSLVDNKLNSGPLTLSEVDRARQIINAKLFGNAPSADDARLGGNMLRNFDEFTDSTVPSIGGDNLKAVQALKTARELNKRVSKTTVLEDALNKAERQASVTGSGGNVDNATRQKINAILNNKKIVKSFSAEERAMMEKLARGTEVGNKLRLAGKLSPSGNGLMAALGIGGAMTNPILGIPSLVGIGAKALADRTTKKTAETLLAMVKTGKPVAELSGSPNAVQRLAESKREALARMLTLGLLKAAPGQ